MWEQLEAEDNAGLVASTEQLPSLLERTSGTFWEVLPYAMGNASEVSFLERPSLVEIV